MLMPKETRDRLEVEKVEFAQHFQKVLDLMGKVMNTRGKKRDSDTPLFYRRTPEGNLSMAEGKIRRARTILGAIDTEDPDFNLLGDLLEETMDGANYLAFVAALCSLMMEEEE